MSITFFKVIHLKTSQKKKCSTFPVDVPFLFAEENRTGRSRDRARQKTGSAVNPRNTGGSGSPYFSYMCHQLRHTRAKGLPALRAGSPQIIFLVHPLPCYILVSIIDYI